MKKIILIMAAIMASVIPVKAAEVAYNQALVNQVVETTTSFTLDLNAYGIDAVSFQATVSSALVVAQTFNDGHISSGTVTVSSFSALIAKASSDTITVTTNSALSLTSGSDSFLTSNTNGISGSSITIVTVSSHTFAFGVQLSSTIATSTGTAINIAGVINANVENVTATVSGSSVIITCNSGGLYCNGYLISSTTNTVVAKTAAFTGGNNNATFTIGNTPVGSFVFTQGQQWSQQSLSSNTAISIMNAVNGIPSYFTASTPTTTSVLIQLASSGTFGNSTTLVASTGALTIGTARFIGGQDNATFCLNGTCFIQGTGFTAGTSSATAANSLSTAINASSALTGLVTSTAPLACGLSSPCGVIYATGTILTSGNFNYTMYTSTTALALSSTTLLAGTTSAYTLNQASITIPSHGYATGLYVMFSTGSVTTLGGLTNQTSYYIISINSNNVQLALTSTGAFAGAYITLTSSSTTGPHNFTLTPVGLNGANTLTWSVSNDGVQYSTPTVTATNVTVPINSLATPWAKITYGYDFGTVDFKYLRLTVSGPGTAGNGGINTVVTGYGKRYWR